MGDKHDKAVGVVEGLFDNREAGESSPGFERFVRDQYRGLVQFLRNRTATLQDAEDAAQESMAKMLRYRESEPERAWKPLLYRVAINVVHDQFRIAATHHRLQHVPLEEQELATPERSPEEEMAYAQRLACLRQAIRELPPKCQRVYLLKRIHGMSQAQVAKHCGISVKMVEKHLAKALRILRQKVGNSVAGTSE